MSSLVIHMLELYTTEESFLSLSVCSTLIVPLFVPACISTFPVDSDVLFRCAQYAASIVYSNCIFKLVCTAAILILLLEC